MIHIIHKIPHATDALLRAYAEQAAATVHEAMGQRGAMTPDIKPIAKGMKFCGRALTVRCHAGDNLMLIKAISMAKPGDVIVADMGRILNAGPFGEVLATECVARGMAGLVVSGAVRDGQAIAELGFPVFAAGLSVCGTSKATLGTINHPITCGQEIVQPGDIILGDDDGVVVVPLEEAEKILEAARKRTAKEAAVMEQLRAGASLFDLYGYQKTMDALGCIEESI